MITSIDTGNYVTKIQHSPMIQTLNKLGAGENFSTQ